MKKKFEIAFLILWGTLIVGLTLFHVYLHFSDKVLVLFNCVFDKDLLKFSVCFLMFIGYAIIVVPEWIKKKSSRKRIFTMCTFLVAVLIFTAWAFIDTISDGIKECRISQRLTLSDGTGILLTEETERSSVDKKYELKYLNIYQLSFITAERIGLIDETVFSNNCLEQGKYEYEYDEKSKLFTVICEYGEYGDDTVFLKEEYDTGFMSYEFELE